MGRPKRRELGKAPSHEEFEAVLNAEFGFLVAEHGFRQHASPSDPWRQEFERERCCISVTGAHYGQGAYLEIKLDGEPFPLFEVCPSYATRFTPTSDHPQLDELREGAYRLRNHLLPVVRGDYALVEEARRLQSGRAAEREARRAADPRGTFFSVADALWKNKKWSALVAHLACSPQPLTSAWQVRLQEAEEHLE